MLYHHRQKSTRVGGKMTILIINNPFPGCKKAGALKMSIYQQERLLFTRQMMFCANFSLRICWPVLNPHDLISLVQKEHCHNPGWILERDEVASDLPGLLVTMHKISLYSELNSTLMLANARRITEYLAFFTTNEKILKRR